jgi:hypothetical protein
MTTSAAAGASSRTCADPAKAENALAYMPGHREFTVRRTPDYFWDESAAALVIGDRPGPSLDGIRAYLQGRPASQKWPQRLTIAGTLPHGAPGKFQYQQLASLLGRQRNAQPGAGHTGDHPTCTPKERP